MRAPHTQTDTPALSRRRVLTTAAWSAPVIAAAIAAPAASASDPATLPLACQFTPTTWTVTPGSTPLVEDGRAGTPFGANGQYSTGWTPINTNPGHATQAWWLPGPAAAGAIGFLSMADRDNSGFAAAPVATPSDAAPDEAQPLTLQVAFQLEATAGSPLELQFPVHAGSEYLGRQYLEIGISGAGIPETTIAKGFAGDTGWGSGPTMSNIPAAYQTGFAPLASEQTYTSTVTPTSTGTVIATYTFTLMAVTNNQFKNADIWVQAPQVANCPASTS
ncbi:MULTISPECIES: hypothetical protein [unclassified Pseudoclavibacter]|uniref:hypothetical protein n=1 Tax=unclassified Pseudoclavibacter TaxID=2615177 RepID=UPI001BA550A5|nr:hypothetical protein [Pseudoclavibacter sp. Marseille-Q4354]MBS3180169.1 hypothetical protein [Pseudoclavibacter sp. Marseille-Q4354]